MRFHDNILRDYQEDMKRCAFEAWEHHQSIMVQIPTGTGKPHLLASIIQGATMCLVHQENGIKNTKHIALPQRFSTFAKTGCNI